MTRASTAVPIPGVKNSMRKNGLRDGFGGEQGPIRGSCWRTPELETSSVMDQAAVQGQGFESDGPASGGESGAT